MLESYSFKKTDYQSCVRSNIDPTLYLNDYSVVLNESFKEKLLASLKSVDQRYCFIELFNN